MQGRGRRRVTGRRDRSTVPAEPGEDPGADPDTGPDERGPEQRAERRGTAGIVAAVGPRPSVPPAITSTHHAAINAVNDQPTRRRVIGNGRLTRTNRAPPIATARNPRPSCGRSASTRRPQSPRPRTRVGRRIQPLGRARRLTRGFAPSEEDRGARRLEQVPLAQRLAGVGRRRLLQRPQSPQARRSPATSSASSSRHSPTARLPASSGP